jgi:hypothetical protein
MNLQIQALNLAYAALANTDTERGTAQFELESEARAAILEAREQLDNKDSSAVQEPVQEWIGVDLSVQGTVQEWMKPHPKCDQACLFLCTKGFTQFPECANVRQKPIKPVVDPDLDANQRLAFKLGWKSAEEAHNIK